MPWNFVSWELSSVIVPVDGSARSRRMFPRRKLLPALRPSFLERGLAAAVGFSGVVLMRKWEGNDWRGSRVTRAQAAQLRPGGCQPDRSNDSGAQANFPRLRDRFGRHHRLRPRVG